MNNGQIILIVFRLINFAVLIGIFWYLWRRFGKQYVQAGYDQQQDHLDTLARTHTVLRKEATSIKKTISGEDEERSSLKERLFMWRQAVSNEHASLQEHLDKRREQLDRRLKEQIQRVAEYRLYQAVRDEAIKEVRDQLSQQYAAKASQEMFVARIIQKMESE